MEHFNGSSYPSGHKYSTMPHFGYLSFNKNSGNSCMIILFVEIMIASSWYSSLVLSSLIALTWTSFIILASLGGDKGLSLLSTSLELKRFFQFSYYCQKRWNQVFY